MGIQSNLRVKLGAGFRPSAFLSYTWGGRSRSPAYAFKVRKDFDDGLRAVMAKLFGLMAWAKFGRILDQPCVVGVPPRQSRQWGMQDHLADLLCALEQVNFFTSCEASLLLRGPHNKEKLTVVNADAGRLLRGRFVIVVDNLWNTGQTALGTASKLLESGAAEVHFYMMSRWISGDPQAIAIAKDFRAQACGDLSNLYLWYRDIYCAPALERNA